MIEALLPVEKIAAGHRLILPDGRRVNVERIDSYPDPVDHGGIVYYVRWCGAGRYGRGHKLEGEPVDLGSLKPLRAGELFKVESCRPS